MPIVRPRFQHANFYGPNVAVAKESVHLIVTDPPYALAEIGNYAHLARFARSVLKPGGWCLAYSGNLILPNVIELMQRHLSYGWTFALLHTGPTRTFAKLQIKQRWKPIVGFYKPPLRCWWKPMLDVVQGAHEKELHEWQQGEVEAAYFIEHLSSPGQLIVDPMCGSGTVLAAAQKLGRRSVGIDIDKRAVFTAMRRLASQAGEHKASNTLSLLPVSRSA